MINPENRLGRRSFLKTFGWSLGAMAIGGSFAYQAIEDTNLFDRQIDQRVKAEIPNLIPEKEAQEAKEQIRHYREAADNLGKSGQIDQILKLFDGKQLEKAYQMKEQDEAITDQRFKLMNKLYNAPYVPVINIRRRDKNYAQGLASIASFSLGLVFLAENAFKLILGKKNQINPIPSA